MVFTDKPTPGMKSPRVLARIQITNMLNQHVDHQDLSCQKFKHATAISSSAFDSAVSKLLARLKHGDVNLYCTCYVWTIVSFGGLRHACVQRGFQK